MPCFITIEPVDGACGEVSFMSFILQHRDIISPQRLSAHTQVIKIQKRKFFGQQPIYPVKIILILLLTNIKKLITFEDRRSTF